MNENENGGFKSFFEEHKKKLAAFAVCLLILLLILILPSRQKKTEEEPQPGAETGKTAESESAGSAASEAAAGAQGTGAEAAEEAETGKTAETAEAGATVGAQTAAPRSRTMDELDRQLRAELEEKSGDWSLYLYRFDTKEEIGINANEPMISASLIKLYIAGCYLEKTAKGEIPDEYQDQLFLMLSQSDNGSTNTLIDLLGMDEINDFIKKHHFEAGRLNRKMLEQNGTENYTSSEDCGKVLRAVYERRYVGKEASDRIMDALRAQIERNRAKIPAGVPEGVETANKTGELFTKNADGVNVDVQNDAAVIFAEDHPYVLVVMSAVPGVGEAEMHRQIAELSREVYDTVCGEEEAGEDKDREDKSEENEDRENKDREDKSEENEDRENKDREDKSEENKDRENKDREDKDGENEETKDGEDKGGETKDEADQNTDQ